MSKKRMSKEQEEQYEKKLDELAERWTDSIMQGLVRENLIPACRSCVHWFGDGNRNPASGEITDCCSHEVPPARCDSKSGCSACTPKVISSRTPACENLKRRYQSKVAVNPPDTKRVTSKKQIKYYGTSILVRDAEWSDTIIPCYDCGTKITQPHANSYYDYEESMFVLLCFDCSVMRGECRTYEKVEEE